MRPALRNVSLLAMFLSMTSIRVAQAGGLSCSVGEVVVENLKIGHRYSLRTLANLPLTLTNTADRAVAIAVEPQSPGDSELRQGAAPIPTVGWAHAMPDTFALLPGEHSSTDLVLDVPDDPALLGKRFEVVFWSHTLPDPTEMVAVGTKSRVIFSIDSERDTTEVVPSGDLGLELGSASFDLSHAPLGRELALAKLTKQPITIRNTSQRSLTVTLDVRRDSEDRRNRDGDLLSVASVRLVPAVITLAPGEQRNVEGFVTLHGPKPARGRTFRCTVTASVQDLPVRTEIQGQLSGVEP